MANETTAHHSHHLMDVSDVSPKHDVLCRNCSATEDSPEWTKECLGVGYHLTQIPKGELGTSSKIREELDELIDAEHQGVSIMVLVELSDIVGAIESYLENNFPTMGLQDLKAMSDVTKRAFRNGRRS